MAAKWGQCSRFVLPQEKGFCGRMREARASLKDVVPLNTGKSQTADSTYKGKKTELV